MRYVTDLAEIWSSGGGHPKNSLETHIFEFGPTVRDLERFLRKNRAKNENCFLAVIFFQMGLAKSW